MIWAIYAAAIVANGFGRRFAGGLLSQWLGPLGGTQVARAAQAALVAASVVALAWVAQDAPGLAWWAPLPAAAATFLGATWGFPGYSLRWPFIDMRVSRMVARNLVDTIGLSINGIVACAPLAACAWAIDMPAWPMLLAGIARGPAWWIAAAWVPHLRWMGFWWFAPDQNRWIPMPTAVAEFYSGMAVGAGLVATLAIGA